MLLTGNIGVDIVLEATLGPLMLEVNARPGLSIQIANQKGLLPFLKQVEGIKEIPHSVAERVQIRRKIFE